MPENERVERGVRDSEVIVTGRQKREVSAVKLVKASCSSGVTVGLC